jgi:hypothetical protein
MRVRSWSTRGRSGRGAGNTIVAVRASASTPRTAICSRSTAMSASPWTSTTASPPWLLPSITFATWTRSTASLAIVRTSSIRGAVTLIVVGPCPWRPAWKPIQVSAAMPAASSGHARKLGSASPAAAVARSVMASLPCRSRRRRRYRRPVGTAAGAGAGVQLGRRQQQQRAAQRDDRRADAPANAPSEHRYTLRRQGVAASVPRGAAPRRHRDDTPLARSAKRTCSTRRGGP